MASAVAQIALVVQDLRFFETSIIWVFAHLALEGILDVDLALAGQFFQKIVFLGGEHGLLAFDSFELVDYLSGGDQFGDF